MEQAKRVGLYTATATVGGLGYVGIEMLWRGRSHWSMFLVGGVCFVLMGGIHTALSHRPLLLRCGVCAAAVTAVELASGCILNRWLGLGVWDYSGAWGNILGQVCLGYSLLWLLLSVAACPLYKGVQRLLQPLFRL